MSPLRNRWRIHPQPATRSKWVWVILSVLVLLASVGFFLSYRADRRTKIELHRIQADVFAAQSQWDQAAAELEKVLALDQRADSSWLMLGDMRSRQGRLDEALGCLAEVPPGSPRRADALLLEGGVWLKKGFAVRAEAAFKQCLAVDRRSIAARRRLVFLYAVKLRRQELHQILWELVELRAAQSLDLVLLSGSSFIVWNAAEILPTVEGYVAADPSDATARTALGRYRLKQNDPDGAQRVLREACRLAPSDLEPHLALAECLIETAGPADTEDFLKKLSVAWPRDPRVMYLNGRMAEDSDRVADAIQCFRQATEGDPDHKESHYRLGQLLVASGHDAEAQRHLQRSKALAEREILLSTVVSTGEPQKYAARIARLEAELGHAELAEIWYGEGVRLRPSDADLRSEAAAFLTGARSPAAK